MSIGELIVYKSGVAVCVAVCLSTFSNIFSSETAGPIEVNLHMKPPWGGGKKVCINYPDRMLKMLRCSTKEKG